LPPLLLQTTPPTDIYTLSLHDALPISPRSGAPRAGAHVPAHARLLRAERARERARRQPPARGRGTPAGAVRRAARRGGRDRRARDRKSTRLNSSHVKISYAVFCLKKKK